MASSGNAVDWQKLGIKRNTHNSSSGPQLNRSKYRSDVDHINVHYRSFTLGSPLIKVVGK